MIVSEQKRELHLKVLVVPSYYGFGGRSEFGRSGAGVFFQSQASALARNGHEVNLLYVHFDSQRGVSIETVEDSGISCTYVHARPLPLPVNLLYRMILMLWAYRKVFRAQKPDVLHAHCARAGLFAWPISAVYKVPYVLTEHSSALSRRVPYLWRLAARWSYGHAAALVAVSQGLAKDMKTITSREVRIVPNLVEREFYTGGQPQRTLPSHAKGFHFLSVGNCHPNKGWDILLRSFADLLQTGAKAKLTLCGGQDCPELESLSLSLGISDRVEFKGRVGRATVRDLMAACHCHVMASRIETFGIANIEAMAVGRPVIMTDTYAAHDIVEPQSGIIVPIENESQLTAALTYMMQNATHYDPVAIQKSCLAKYSEEVVCRSLSGLYERLLAHEHALDPTGANR